MGKRPTGRKQLAETRNPPQLKDLLILRSFTGVFYSDNAGYWLVSLLYEKSGIKGLGTLAAEPKKYLTPCLHMYEFQFLQTSRSTLKESFQVLYLLKYFSNASSTSWCSSSCSQCSQSAHCSSCSSKCHSATTLVSYHKHSGVSSSNNATGTSKCKNWSKLWPVRTDGIYCCVCSPALSMNDQF